MFEVRSAYLTDGVETMHHQEFERWHGKEWKALIYLGSYINVIFKHARL